MGHYTTLKFKANLKKDTSEKVIDFLHRVVNEKDLRVDDIIFKSEDVFTPLFDHPFFKCERWVMLLISKNWPRLQGGKFYKQKGYWCLDLHTEFKNYGNEICEFVDWISPMVAGRKKKEYVGYYRSESCDSETNIYIER